MQGETQVQDLPDDMTDVADIARTEIEDAKARLSDAAGRMKAEARQAGTTISSLVMDELDRRAADMGGQLRVLAGRMRGDPAEDGADQSAPQIADQAAGLIEDLSQRMEGQSVRQLGARLDRFGRDNPTLFLLGCLITGAIGGRIIVAQTETDARTSMQDQNENGRYPARRSRGGNANDSDDDLPQDDRSDGAAQDFFGVADQSLDERRDTGTAPGQAPNTHHESTFHG